ncbi:MAG: hypothetical protein M1834_003385 [Cirrosporium novae-zelandiae]|nr:MAG: hypothetical protein M1834_003385 [Cirrosporium novae-zelandiae]
MASSLGSSVSSLQSSLSLLESTISILDSGVSDFPRLGKVLQTTRHFELLPESQLAAAQSALLSELTPAIASLLVTVSNYLDKLERREQTLIAKYQLQEGRLSQPGRAGHANRGSEQKKATASKPHDPYEVEMRRLRQKKERLELQVERLGLQAGQRERELRKSMAFQ